MRLIHKAGLVVIVLFLFLFSSGLPNRGVRTAHAAWSQPSNAFQTAPCMVQLPPGIVEGKDIVCGYLTVPAEHANPDGASLQLAVAIIKSLDPDPKADPLILAQGGPGGSTIETYVAPIFSHSELRADRDIVLFDQRGTLYSKPALYCTEIDQLTADTIEQVLTRDEAEHLNLEALTACRERLAQDGINLSDFDSLENAADIEDLRKALGYDEINLYGVSYGTLLALHYMHNFPSSLRSVILDGVVPPQTNFILGSGKTMDQSFTRLFQTCQQEDGCNRQYPDLEQVFLDTVEKLNQTPARVRMIDPETGAIYNKAAIDGDTFLSGIFQLLYVGDLIPMLPRMIYDAHEGNFDAFARILSILVFDRSMSYGMYYSVVCAEDADFTPADHDLSGVRPVIADIEQRTPQSLLDVCKTWDVQPLGPSADQPVQSNIPTLVLSGGFDPITPPEYAASVVSSLTNSFYFVFPTGGHGQMLDGDCADSMILSFLANPSQAPDSSCIDPQAIPDFLTTENTIDLPMLIKLLNLDPAVTLGFLTVSMLLLFLWTSILVFPLAWLIERSHRRPVPVAVENTGGFDPPEDNPVIHQPPKMEQRRSLLLRISSWLPVFASVTLSLFWLAFIVAAVVMVSDNDNRLFYGLAGEARPWFVLVLIFALLSLSMLSATILGWARRHGPVWRRLYYTLLTLSALCIIGVLASWGMLTAMF